MAEAELEEALAALIAQDPDMADLESIVGDLLTPQMERFEKEHVEPLAKIIEDVSINAEPLNGKTELLLLHLMMVYLFLLAGHGRL